MRYTIILLTLFFQIFLSSAVFASGAEVLTREERMMKAMNCLSEQQKQTPSVNWDDICVTSDKVAEATTNEPGGIADNPTASGINVQMKDSRATSYSTSDSGRLLNSGTLSSPEAEESPWSDFFNPRHPLNDFAMGPEVFYYTYREPSFMKLKGMMYGVFMQYTHRTRENPIITGFRDMIRGIFDPYNEFNMFKFEGYFNYGELDYTSEGTGSDDGEPNYVFHGKLLAGHDMRFMENFRVTPYGGVGYRYLKDDSGGRVTTTGAFGYDRESNYFYIPLGIETNHKFGSSWSLTCNMEYDFLLWGTQRSHLEDVDPGYNTIKNDQKSGYGFVGSFRIKKAGERFDFYIEPFFRYWKIKDSDISPLTYSGVAIGYGLEPENNTTEAGVRLGMRY